MKEMRRRRFVEAVNGILRELDFEELDRSCNGRDPSYAQEILQKMQNKQLRSWSNMQRHFKNVIRICICLIA